MPLLGIGLWSDVHWVLQATWSKGDLEDLAAAKSSFLLLAGHAWEMIDYGTKVPLWFSGFQ
jgi:hypothetical protein